jgi:group I intron endonuclease
MSEESDTKVVYGVIYKITNLVNNKVYIGQTTKPIEERWKGHNRKNGCRSIHNALQKYGIDNFKIEKIDSALNKNELDEKEKLYIKQYKSNIKEFGYNLTDGGANKKLCDESRKMMSDSSKRRVFSEETRRKIGKAHKGKVIKPEIIEKIRKIKTGMKYKVTEAAYWSRWPKERYEARRAKFKRKYHTEEERKKHFNNVIKNRRRMYAEEFKKNGKLIGIRCLDNNIIYPNYASAARDLNINVCALREHVVGLYTNAGGYKFEPIFKTLESEGES